VKVATLPEALPTLVRRPNVDPAIVETVGQIIEDVRRRGDAALLEAARKFDAPDLDAIHVSQDEIDAAMPPVEHTLALDAAVRRVLAFHEDQLANLVKAWERHVLATPEERRSRGNPRHHAPSFYWTWNADGAGTATLGQRLLPLQSAGVYVPGGNATYPSSVVMNAIPAQVAGVDRVVITTPARRDGTLAPAILYAARYCGAAQVVKIGGAAAVAALALGTESIAPVDKVVGPGNRYVNEAKRQLWGQVGLDGYAGPSEVAVVVDDTTNPSWAAADLLTQVEHAPDNAAFLIALSEPSLKATLDAVEALLINAEREPTMRAALRGESLAILVRDREEACEAINAIAPEHLTLAVSHPENYLPRIRNAGAILMGEFTPESAGDFAMGPSHTLPTSGAARFGSPVNVLDFLKVQSLANMDRAMLEELTPIIEAFAKIEGFPMHGMGATIRRLD